MIKGSGGNFVSNTASTTTANYNVDISADYLMTVLQLHRFTA